MPVTGLHGYPNKIALEQIEDGYKIINFLKEFETYRNNVSLIIDLNIPQKISAYDNEMRALQNELASLKNNYASQINRLNSDLQSQIDEINAILNNCRKTSDYISMPDLDEALRNLIKEIAFKLDYVSKHIGEIPTAEYEDLPNANYEKDKDGNTKLVRWESYFIASTSSIVRIKDIPDFRNNLDRVISNEDWYGPNYANGDFSGSVVECWYYGPLDALLTADERAYPDGEEKINAAKKYIADNLIECTYVPKTNIDSEEYPKTEYFEDVSYDEEAMIFKFSNVSSTRHLFKIIKFIN